MGVLGTESIVKELPDRAEFYQELAGKMLWWAASERKLHEVAAAMDALESTEIYNPAHLRILAAYSRAKRSRPDGCPPTLAELRAQFLRQHDVALLPKGFALRKMVLRTLKLPLSRAKCGRPKNPQP